MIISLFIGIGVSILNTRFLSVEDYGKLKFIQQLFALTATIFAFGFSNSASTLVARSGKHKMGGIIGGTVMIYAAISCLSTLAIIFLSLVINDVFDTDMAFYIRLLSPLIFVSIFALVIENLFQGTNKIYGLVIFRLIPRILYIVGSLLFILVASRFNLSIALLLDFVFSAGVTIWMVMTLEPKFIQLKQSLKLVLQENRVNGLHIYFGSLVAVATGQFISIALGYFSDMKSVAFYSLAIVVATPIQYIPSVMGTTLFKSFANKPSIPAQVIWTAVLPTAASLLVFWLFFDKILVLIYSSSYLPVVPFAKILSIGMVFHGLGDFFNRFLGAHGKGRALRNAAFSSGATIFTGCLLFLPRYGAVGGAAVKAFSSFVYFLVTSLYYVKISANLSYEKPA